MAEGAAYGICTKAKNVNEQSALVNNKYFKMLKYMVLGEEREHDGKESKGHLLKVS